jgi:hypothetical protein
MSEQHGFYITVEVVERGTWSEAFAAALEEAQRIFDEAGEASIVVKETGSSMFVGVPNGVYCEGCEGCIFPGIRWPTATDCDTSRSWVERCDACGRYDTDFDAADAVYAHYLDAGDNLVRGQAMVAGGLSPYVEVG